MSAEDPRQKIPGVPRHRREFKALADGREPFFPNFLLKEWIAGAVFLAGFMLWVIYNPVILGPKADPTDTTFIPVPDWYFLFLFQFLKYFPGPDIILPGVVIPVIAILLMMFVPWLDRSKSRRPFRRPLATASMMLFIFMSIWLTAEAWGQHEVEIGAGVAQASSSNGLPFAVQHPTSKALLNTSMPGYTIFQQNCAGCHGSQLEGSVGPELRGIGNVATAQQLLPVVTKGFSPMMPPGGGLSDPKQLQSVVDWLAQQKQH